VDVSASKEPDVTSLFLIPLSLNLIIAMEKINKIRIKRCEK
jgi:hypothetical protein